MRVLVLGGTGFIGRHIVKRLVASGHQVVIGARHKPRTGNIPWLACDFQREYRVHDWLPKLAGVDVLVNAVGIIQETRTQTFARLHDEGPCAVFEACARQGVKQVIQISALGADARAQSAYHQSKYRADRFLLDLPLAGTVLRPSLVYGVDGDSSRLFRAISLLPMWFLFRGGDQRVQPVHIDDLADLVLGLADGGPAQVGAIPVCGPRVLTFAELLQAYRCALIGRRARVFFLSEWLADAAAAIGSRCHWLFNRDTWGMLKRGNAGDAEPARAALGRPLRDPEQFIEAPARSSLRAEAALLLGAPLLRVTLAMMWLAAGLTSAILYPRESALALLAPLGLSEVPATFVLWSASLLDIVMGVWLLWGKHLRPLLLLQLVVMFTYSVLVAVFLPEYWMHPFGPLVKNLPVMAATMLLWLHEER